MSDPQSQVAAEKSSSRFATVKRKDSEQSHDSSKSEESLSTTPKQSQSMTGLHAHREGSQVRSSASQGGDPLPSIRSNTPLQVSVPHTTSELVRLPPPHPLSTIGKSWLAQSRIIAHLRLTRTFYQSLVCLLRG